MANQGYTTFQKGMFRDINPSLQGEGTYFYALNATHRSVLQELGYIYFEASNKKDAYIGQVTIVGSIYMYDGKVCIISTDGKGKDEIGVYDEVTRTYQKKVSANLSLNPEYQIEGIYRRRLGCEDNIYFTDNLNPVRFYNLSRPELFQDATGQFDINKIKFFTKESGIPRIENISVITGGDLLPGKYFVGIQYVDDDGQAEAPVILSSGIKIYNDSVSANYFDINGSTGIKDVNYAQFTSTNKAIEVDVSNIDKNYTFYRLIVFIYASGTGELTRIEYTENIPVDQKKYIYTGNSGVGEMTLEEFQVYPAYYETAKNIATTGEELLLSNLKGPQINLCGLQKYASKIKADVITQRVVINDIKDRFSPKNPTGEMWLMPGEIYSYGIQYFFKGNYRSPVYHIPGRSPYDKDVNNKMLKNNMCHTSVYSTGKRNMCGSEKNYWGQDYTGKDLIGEKIRHHRVPTRRELGIPFIQEEKGAITNSKEVEIKYKFNTAATTQDTKAAITIVVDYVNLLNEPLQKVFYFNFDVPMTITETSLVIGTITDLNSISNITLIETDSTKYNLTYISHTLKNISTDKENTSYITYAIGINFSNIDIPTIEETNGMEIIGYQILRQERKDLDKTILDTGILTCGMASEQYSSVGMFNPAIVYDSSNKTIPVEANERPSIFKELKSHKNNTTGDEMHVPSFSINNPLILAVLSRIPRASYSGNIFGVIHPEHRFNQKEYTDVTEISIEGFWYNKDVPEVIGDLMQDVQEGSSYDPEIHKKQNKDFDGFDLKIASRLPKKKFVPLTENIIIKESNISESFYLDALFSKTPELNINNKKEIFNVSGDNKFGVLVLKKALNPGYAIEKFPYIILKKENKEPYSNFTYNPYYRQTSNITYVTAGQKGSSVNVFEGDVTVTNMSPTTSLFIDIATADRKRKTSIFRYIFGILTIAVAIVAAYFTGGASLSLIGVGLSLISSGLKLDRAKQVYSVLWEKGLRNNVFDDLGRSLSGAYLGPDDEIRWLMDNAGEVFFESSVNMHMRYKPTAEVPAFFSPFGSIEELKQYSMEKLTVLDPDRGSSRSYRGYPMSELNLLNPDYMVQKQGFKDFHLPSNYDCCTDCLETFPERVIYSRKSFAEEKTDNFKTFRPLDYKNMPFNTGPVNNMVFVGGKLYVHTKEAIYELPRAARERVQDNLITFIGDGSYFAMPPNKMVEDSSGNSVGLTDKFSTNTFLGAYFFMSKEGNPYILDGGKLQNLALQGMSFFFNKDRTTYTGADNPSGPLGGYHSVFDYKNNRIILTRSDKGHSWTLGYDVIEQKWLSFYSYLPHRYISANTHMLSFLNVDGQGYLWRHGEGKSTLKFYEKIYPFEIETRIPTFFDQEGKPKTLESIGYRGEYYELNSGKEYVKELDKTFTKIHLYNSTQTTGEVKLRLKQEKSSKNFFLNSVSQKKDSIINLSRIENRYTFNEIRDKRKDYDSEIHISNEENKSIFTTQNKYFESSSLNTENITTTPVWTETKVLRDNYVGIRLIFDNQVDNSDIKLKYVYLNDQESYR